MNAPLYDEYPPEIARVKDFKVITEARDMTVFTLEWSG
jgi:hypothetical protein